MIRHLFLAVVLACLGLGAHLLGQHGADAYVQQTQTRVQKILDVMGFDWAQINVDGLRVTVSGQPPNADDHQKILEILRAKTIFATINDALVPAPPSWQPQEPVMVEIHRDSNGLTLIGRVASSTMQQRLNALLDQAAGGLARTDLIDIRAAQPGSDWGAEFKIAARAVGRLANAYIRVQPGSVLIEGETSDSPARTELESALRAEAGTRVKLMMALRVPEKIIAPFQFVASKATGQGIKIDRCAVRTKNEQIAVFGMLREKGIRAPDQICVVGLGGPPGDWTGAIGAGLDALALVPAGRFVLDDTNADLQAIPPSTKEGFDTALGHLMNTLPGKYRGAGQLHVTGLTNALFKKQARYWLVFALSDKNLSIYGQTGGGDLARALTTYAKALFPNKTVISKLRPGKGAPPDNWQKAALASLRALARFGHGTARLSGENLRLSTEIRYPREAYGVRKALLEAAPNYTVETRFKVDLPDAVAMIPLPGVSCAEMLNAQLAQAPISFEVNSATITKDSHPIIGKLVETLGRCPSKHFEIGGHTDSQGPEDYNLELSQSRAQAVRQALIRAGIAPERLVAHGYGEGNPIADNDTPEGRAQNRRIAFLSVE